MDLESARSGMFFDRWNLHRGVHFETVLNALIELSPDDRPVLIFDTNPNPQIWHTHNILGPEVDARFPGQTYAQLSDSQRHSLFAKFADQIEGRIGVDKPPVLIIDHHFRSHVLSEISTTPLVVDFLFWLKAHPERHVVRQVLREGIILRDHSDPDIVLASFALRLLDQPIALERWATLIRRIALLNDHAYLNPHLNEGERHEVLIGLILMEAFEKEILRRFPNGFEWALDHIASGLNSIRQQVATWPAGEIDPIGRFLREASPPLGLESIFALMQAEGEIKRQLGLTLHTMLESGQNVEHRGRSLILHFPDSQPSGLDVVQYLRLHPSDIPMGVKVILTVGKKPATGASQVKLRVTEPSFSLDRVFDAIVAKGIGGGGRSAAGALYGTSGEIKTESELNADLAWVTQQIEGI